MLFASILNIYKIQIPLEGLHFTLDRKVKQMWLSIWVDTNMDRETVENVCRCYKRDMVELYQTASLEDVMIFFTLNYTRNLFL